MKLTTDFPTSPEPKNSLAWSLAACPVPRLRDPNRAVEWAEKAVALSPSVGNYWNTLGVAYYRAGAWKHAVEALEKSMALNSGGSITDWLFLAMAHWRLGDQPQARRWYNRAVETMEKDQETEQSRRFRAEAAALLGLAEPAPK
jgi:uncharacterized protein HemY